MFTALLLLAGMSAVAAVQKRNLDMCTVCTGVVSDIKARLVSGSSVAQALGDMTESGCTAFGTNQPECEGIVDQFGNAIVLGLAAHAGPAQVCQKVALCSSAAAAAQSLFFVGAQDGIDEQTSQRVQRELAADATPALPRDAGCSLCEAIVGFVEGYVQQNQTEQKIAQQITKLCKVAGPYQQVCDNLVNTYLPQIIQYIDNAETPQQICLKIKLCSSHVVTAAVAQPASSGVCSICQSIVGFIEAYVQQNQTVAQIEQQLDGVCALTGPYEQICDNLVTQYVPQLIQYVEQDYSPKEACTDIGLCQASKLVKLAQAAPQAGGVCSICQSIVGFVEAYVEQNQTVVQIEQQLQGVCALTGPYEQICDNLVTQYVPQLIQYVEQDYTPQEACQQIGLCSTVAAVAPKPKDGGTCSICEALVGFIESYVGQNQTQQQIEQQLDQLCQLTGPYEQACDNLVSSYVPQLIQYVEQDYTPQEACTDIGVCSSASAQVTAASNQFCQVCQLGVGYLEQTYANGTVGNVTALAEKACTSLPQQFQQQCVILVDAYVPSIVQDITQKETPLKVCTQINLCSKNAPAIVAPTKALAVAGGSPALCGLCKTVVSYVELFLSHGAGMQVIAKQLHQLCALTQGFKAQCDALINSELPAIIQYVTDMKSPEEICNLAGMLCPAPVPSPTSL